MTAKQLARAAPPVFPLPHHRALGDSYGRLYRYEQGEQRVCKGWWPSLYMVPGIG